MKYVTCLILLLKSFTSDAQDISGIWQGKLTQEPGGCFPEYYIELQIKTFNRDLEGVSYDYYDTTKYVKLNFTGTLAGNNKKTITIVEKKVLKEKIPEECIPCMKTYNLVYSRQNDEESLSGRWVGEDMGTIAGCPPGNIYLRRVTKSAFEEKKVRKTELVQTYYVDSSDVKISFYDNGIIDGDSITVFFDNQVIVSKKGLSLEPIKVDLTLQPLREYQMVVYAENLGTISPNTALVVVTSGSKRYEILLSSNEEKNSSIKFIYNNKPGKH
jgi:archaellum component FlaF (FlaF/FlaG flagellin family)